jgi:hypothetical protein
MVDRYGELADFLVELHPHMLRHACGVALADKTQTHGSFKTISDTKYSAHCQVHGDQPGTV